MLVVAFPFRPMSKAFKPCVTGLDIKPHKPSAEDEGREEPRAAPGINRARVYGVAFGDLCARSPEHCVFFV